MKLYDTMTRRKEEFAPRNGEVRMYVCGVTPYAESHVGHAMSYIIFDVLRRYLEYSGYKVKHVQNFTDIDDKLIDRANKLGATVAALSSMYIDEYFHAMDALNIKRAQVYPRATQEVPKIIEMIQGLLAKGFAYQSSGDVYFRVLRLAEYGKLSHRTREGMKAGARIEASTEKEHPMDFVLWKGAKPGEPQWDSPWGTGRPGWHIECSAMSLKYLGETIDIHGGGQDLIFPHHENEIAQSESFTGVQPFVRFWVHNGLLQLGEEKMSKSLGNLVTVKEVLQRHSPDALRLFVLSGSYRGPLSFSEDGLEAMERGAERLRAALQPGPQGKGVVDVDSYRRRFREALDDDMNTAQAVAVLFDLSRDINREREAGHSVAGAQAIQRELGDVLGLTFTPRPARLELDVAALAHLLQEVRGKLGDGPTALAGASQEDYLRQLVDLRAACRKQKRYDLADRIRDRLTELGVQLEDTPKGTVWKAAERTVASR